MLLMSRAGGIGVYIDSCISRRVSFKCMTFYAKDVWKTALPMTGSIEGIPVDTTSWLLCEEARNLGIKMPLPAYGFFLQTVRHFDCCSLTGNTAGAGSVLTLLPWGRGRGISTLIPSQLQLLEKISYRFSSDYSGNYLK